MPKVDEVQPGYLGIDPGKSGGLVLLTESMHLFDYLPMPNSELDIWEAIKLFSEQREVKALIEKVHSMPQQGVASSFTFGTGYGGLRMALTASNISFETIDPRAWQKALGIPPRKKEEAQPQFKERLRAHAQRLYPKWDLWKKGKGIQLSVCDAALIATHCKRKHTGTL